MSPASHVIDRRIAIIVIGQALHEDEQTTALFQPEIVVTGQLTFRLAASTEATPEALLEAARAEACPGYSPGCTVALQSVLQSTSGRRLTGSSSGEIDVTLVVSRALNFPHAPPPPLPPPQPPAAPEASIEATYSYNDFSGGGEEIAYGYDSSNQLTPQLSDPLKEASTHLLSLMVAKVSKRFESAVGSGALLAQPTTALTDVAVEGRLASYGTDQAGIESAANTIRAAVATDLGLTDVYGVAAEKLLVYMPPPPPPQIPPSPFSPPHPPMVPPGWPTLPPNDLWYRRYFGEATNSIGDKCDTDCYGGCYESEWSHPYTWGEDHCTGPDGRGQVCGIPGFKANVTIKRCACSPSPAHHPHAFPKRGLSNLCSQSGESTASSCCAAGPCGPLSSAGGCWSRLAPPFSACGLFASRPLCCTPLRTCMHAGRTVVLDIDLDVEMMSLVVWGTLVVKNRPEAIVKLRVACLNIMCVNNFGTGTREHQCGKMQAGAPDEPFEGQLAIYTKGDRMTELSQCYGAAGTRNPPARTIRVRPGGQLLLYGRRPARMWSRLRATVEKGSRRLQLLGHVDWEIGDKVTSSSARTKSLAEQTGTESSPLPRG